MAKGSNVTHGSRTAEMVLTSLPSECKIAWISSRRAQSISDVIAANLVGPFLLHEILTSIKLPLDELTEAQHAIVEIPPVAAEGYELKLLKLASSLRQRGITVTFLIQPSLRKSTQRSLWVQRWNQLPGRTFDITQTCSCKISQTNQSCHFTYWIGSTSQR